jgi:hypothetical protein
MGSRNGARGACRDSRFYDRGPYHYFGRYEGPGEPCRLLSLKDFAGGER